MRLSINCPCCESRSSAVKTKPLSKVFTEVTYRCSNTDCNFSFVAGVEVLRALNLGPFELPEELGIPLSQRIDRRKLIQQLKTAPEAPEPSTGNAPVFLASDLVSQSKQAQTPTESRLPNTWHAAVTTQVTARTKATAALG